MPKLFISYRRSDKVRPLRFYDNYPLLGGAGVGQSWHWAILSVVNGVFLVVDLTHPALRAPLRGGEVA